jgi:hypothetical protein
MGNSGGTVKSMTDPRTNDTGVEPAPAQETDFPVCPDLPGDALAS